MARYDLTDFEWRVIEPLLTMKPRGVPRVDDRRVLNGTKASRRASTTAGRRNSSKPASGAWWLAGCP